MDITKRFERILNLFFFLQSKSYVSLDSLKKRFQVSERTIYRDLKALETAGIPIVFEAGTGYALMEGFRIHSKPFTEEEVLSLMVAEKIIDKHETSFIKQQFESALIKIKSAYRFQDKERLTQLHDRLLIHKNTTNTYLPNVLDLLLNALLKKQQATITYCKPGGDHEEQRIIEPVEVLQEHDHWYVFAYCCLRHDYRNFRLDRIKRITLMPHPFSKEHANPESLRNVSKKQTTTCICIKADRKYAHYLHWDRAAFGFEKEDVENDQVFMYFQYKQNPSYFVRWFMMFIDFAEILEPELLRNEISDILERGILKLKKES